MGILTGPDLATLPEYDDSKAPPDPWQRLKEFLVALGLMASTSTKWIWFGAGACETDGTQAAAPARVVINSGAPRWTIITTDNDGASIYFEAAMPKDWDGGPVRVAHHYIQTAADTGVLNGDIAAACRLAGQAINNTWGTEVPIDDAAVSGANKLDVTLSGLVTPNGDTTPGVDRLLQFRYQLDAAGTTTLVASLHHLGFAVEYGVAPL